MENFINNWLTWGNPSPYFLKFFSASVTHDDPTESRTVRRFLFGEFLHFYVISPRCCLFFWFRGGAGWHVEIPMLVNYNVRLSCTLVCVICHQKVESGVTKKNINESACQVFEFFVKANIGVSPQVIRKLCFLFQSDMLKSYFLIFGTPFFWASHHFFWILCRIRQHRDLLKKNVQNLKKHGFSVHIIYENSENPWIKKKQKYPHFP